MSLDSDLGIDSIKRVEILSALQGRLPDAPVVKPEDLGALQTLRQIVAFLGGAGGVVGEKFATSQASRGGTWWNAEGVAEAGKVVLDRRVLTVVPIWRRRGGRS